jgi:anti-sigma factor (TIGR02949 family)
MSDPSNFEAPEEIGCLEAIETLYAYLDGELGDAQSVARVEHHLGHCRSCYSRKELELALTEHLQRSARSRAPAQLQARMRKLLDGF